MSVLKFTTNYKNKIIELLYSNPDFVKLVNPENKYPDYLDTVDVLNGGTFEIDGKKVVEQGYVFDFDFVTDKIEEEKTFLFVEAYITRIRDNFVDFDLYVCFFSKKNLIRLDTDTKPSVKEIREMGYEDIGSYANRIDILADVIEDTILGHTDDFKSIGDIAPSDRDHLRPFNPLFSYYGKSLRYTVKNYNTGSDNSCG